MRQFAKNDFIVTGLLFFSGLCYYYFFRETTVLANWLGIESNQFLHSYAHYFNWFPSFVHPFFFSYITWIILEKKYENIIILFWCSANLLFEFLQAGSPLLSMAFMQRFLQTLFSNSTFGNHSPYVNK